MDGPQGAAMSVEDFGLKGPRGWAFRSVTVDAEPGALVAIEGPSGSGRTCLLLALTGRMRPTEGRAEVAGLQLPRKMAAVRRISALGPVPGVSDLDPALTVAEHLRERALLQRRFDGSLRALFRPRAERAAAAAERVEKALAAAGLDLATLPKRERTAVRDLERLEELRLSVALALIGRPRLLAVDDVGLKLSDTERTAAWGLLRSVADSGTTVLAVCAEAPEDAVVVRTRATATGSDSDDGLLATTGEGTAEDTGQDTGHDHDADAGPDADQDAATATAKHNDEDTAEEGKADAIAETGRA
ncbi:ATP-binding cassette domain-containing protein [Streptomyces pristinaespiralis]|uniref:ABC transporter ATP-binding protein n=1 Tax=Streptomyces pristinaespiralis (strain ATCC 25486 / DSM 40338 / CBS 914.69 / JCM 4507 / KCC S-0507 / NBRC 13074 / NRRL 2958 / 5647) TaxID=457429 RepID=B5HCL0_STRE2|nr:ABC transporter ATP-binding protein [Streptomyces pristinaespiralis ATCC 25486]QMU18368.1 ATP-binding cassette domain-containing protein [Streptomyces pristinaespiralis]